MKCPNYDKVNHMSKVKKILFISCSAGAGHKRAAESLKYYCQKTYPQIEAVHIDLIDYSDWLIKKTVSSTYHLLVKNLPEIYGLIYKSSDTYISAKILNLVVSLLKINTRKLNKYIKDFQPDRIVSTHFLASALVKKFAKKIPLDMVITDYELHKIVLDPMIRKFYTPTEEVKNEIIKLGRRAITTGIPLHPDFFQMKDLNQTYLDFQLNPQFKTILIMCGGYGLINPINFYKQINNNLSALNLIVITGQGSIETIKKIKDIPTYPSLNISIIEYTNRIDELIKIADIVITKPGGLTTTECLAMKKPILIVNPIPGQEEANVKFIEKNNYGRFISNHSELVEYIKLILEKKLFFNIADLPTNSAKKIIEKVLN